MTKPSKITFEPFVKFNIQFYLELRSLIALSKHIQSDTTLEVSERSLSQEALLVKIAAEWEFYILNIFSYCASLNTETLQDTLELKLPPKIGFYNAYAILNGINFLTFRGGDELIGKSKKYIHPDHNPFIHLSRQSLKASDEINILRNYISHKSQNAKKRLLKFYEGKERLNYKTETFLKPGDYLMMSFDDKGDKIIFSHSLYGILTAISVEIWKFLDRKSYDFIYAEYDNLEASIKKENSEEIELLKTTFFQAICKMENVFEYLNEQIDK
jgi:hypothetical protein